VSSSNQIIYCNPQVSQGKVIYKLSIIHLEFFFTLIVPPSLVLRLQQSMWSNHHQFFQWACESDQCKSLGTFFNLHSGSCWHCSTLVDSMPNGRQIMAALTANASVISRPSVSHPLLSSPAISSTVHDSDVAIESPVMTEATLAAKFSDNRELAKSARQYTMKKHIGGRNTPYGIITRVQAHPPRAQVYYFY
jgi:hypothetical protein